MIDSPQPPQPFIPSLENLRISEAAKRDAINLRLHPAVAPLPESLPADAQDEVEDILRRKGPISKTSKEQVSDRDIARLRPFQWLNDELINFYGQLIMDRAADAAKDGSKNALNVHYFSTFFWSKLKTGYAKSRLGKWTKKVRMFHS